MMVDESAQTSHEMERKNFQEKVLREGMELLKRQKEYERHKKLREQKEMRDMLERYWPWGRGDDARPRGLRNLRLEELFPNNDYRNAKRFVGTLDVGRGGGGAPIINSGKKFVKTKEDPLLRFQFGKDLRRCVDNTLRYKTNKDEQLEYKKQLDKMVEEKKKKEQREKQEDKDFHREQFLKSPPWGRRGPGGKAWRTPSMIGFQFLKNLGWSNEKTLKQLENEAIKHKLTDEKTYNNFKKITVVPPIKIIKNEPVVYPRRNFISVGKTRKLNPLSGNKEEGLELVALLAKDRQYPPKIPLCSSDVTSEKKIGVNNVWNRQGSAYLRELAQQMVHKQQQMKEMKAKETECVNRHFSTWESFWGRPGNGAPLPELKKQCLDRLLYPKMAPISVH